MDFGLKEKAALVTGSSRGLGLAIATTLANEQAIVILNGRDSGELATARKKIIDATGSKKVYVMVGEVKKSNDLNRIFRAIGFVGIDILVNNIGGLTKFGKYSDLREKDWRNAFELNFMSMVKFTNRAIPFLLKSNQGRIINISSLPALQPGVFNPHYSASKAAMLNYSKHLANFLGKHDILVNTICPSTLMDGGWQRNVADRAIKDNISEANAEKIMIQEESAKSPLGRVGRAIDVANLVAFLASDKASFITGQCINVDGGIGRSIL